MNRNIIIEVFNDSNLTILDAAGANASGGANDVAASWNGVTTTNVADTNFNNMTIASDTPYFGMNWQVHHVRMFAPGTYSLPGVPWTSFFIFETGVAFHGTFWHNNFGIPMSHGCINLRTDNAEWVYNKASVGTVVNIHY